MNGHEFTRKVNKYADRHGLPCRYVNHGKGSHGRLYLGNRFTTLKNRNHEIGKGLLIAMCKQLGINSSELKDF